MFHFMRRGWHNADNGGSNNYLGEPDGTFTG